MTATGEQVYISVDGKQLEVADGQMISAMVDQDLDQPDMCVLQLANGNDWMAKNTFETGKELKLELQQGKDRQRMFIGEIVGVEPVYEEKNHVKLTVRAFDRVHRLTRSRKSRTFKQMKDSDIAMKIAKDYGFGSDVEDTSVVHEHVYQHNQTDLEFLRIRASRINYELGVDDQKLYFKKQGGPTRPGASASPVKLQIGQGMHTFAPRVSAAKQVAKATIRGWDPAKKAEVVGVATRADVGPKTESPSNGGEAARKAFGSDDEMTFTLDYVTTVKEAEAIAKSLLEQQLLGYITAEALCDGSPALQPAALIEVTGAEKFDGTYTVSSATHRFDRSGYRTTIKSRNSKNPVSFAQSFSGSGGGGGAAAAGGTKFAVGIVTNNEDPEDHGRVKVKLPTHGDDIESDWARMISPMAGGGRGLFILPEVNDEVLVAFEGGGSNAKPIVLGSVWNGSDKAPLEANKAVSGGKVVQRVLKSRAGHTVLLDDTDGNEKVHIEDSKGNKITFECASDKLTIEFKGDIDIKSQKNINIEATGNMTLKATGNIDVNASGMTNVKGSMVNLN
jgi:phage protein D/phage baseplate assembly protein gpV